MAATCPRCLILIGNLILQAVFPSSDSPKICAESVRETPDPSFSSVNLVGDAGFEPATYSV